MDRTNRRCTPRARCSPTRALHTRQHPKTRRAQSFTYGHSQHGTEPTAPNRERDLKVIRKTMRAPTLRKRARRAYKKLTPKLGTQHHIRCEWIPAFSRCASMRPDSGNVKFSPRARSHFHRFFAFYAILSDFDNHAFSKDHFFVQLSAHTFPDALRHRYNPSR